MVDWNELKCPECKSHSICRKRSVTKASPFCKSQKGLLSKHRNTSTSYGADILGGLVKHLSPKQLFRIRKKKEKELDET